MRLSAPVYQLKRRAKRMARQENIALHLALDRIAQQEGYRGWSLLSARAATDASSTSLLDQLSDGDMLLLGARPGHGKTRLGLQLLLDAARDHRRAVFFTLEYTVREVTDHIRRLGEKDLGGIDVIASDDICAASIARHLSGSPRGSVAVIDYLQILDQQRSKPLLTEQVKVLREFACSTGIILAFLSQIDRSFDPEQAATPSLRDIRLPNPIETGAFSKTCFLHNGTIRFQAAA